MNLTSRNEARAKGLTRYSTGQPCKYGHVAGRSVANLGCITCLISRNSAWKKRNVAKCTATKRAWRHANPERVKAIKNAWNKANPEGQKARARKWYEKNKQKSFDAHYKWAERNPEKVDAAAARRRASVLQCTPVWADHDRILSFYEQAKELSLRTGTEHHVDHIVPLQHNRVSGLHVDSNLQILPAFDNRSKSNRHWPGM